MTGAVEVVVPVVVEVVVVVFEAVEPFVLVVPVDVPDGL